MTETRVRCKATTKSGTRCRLTAQPNSDYCHVHADLAIAEEPDAIVDEMETEGVEPAGQDSRVGEFGPETGRSTKDPTESAAEPVAEQGTAQEAGSATPVTEQSGTGEAEASKPEAEVAADVFQADVQDSDLAVDESEQDGSAQVIKDSEQHALASVQSSTAAESSETMESAQEDAAADAGVVDTSGGAAEVNDALDLFEEEPVGAVDAPPFEVTPTADHDRISEPTSGAENAAAYTESEIEHSEPQQVMSVSAATALNTATELPNRPERDDQMALLMADVEVLAQELSRRLDPSGSRVGSPAQAMDLFNQNIGQYAPETQRAIFADLQRNLQDSTYRGTVSPDVLRGLWYMLGFALQNQSQDVRQRVAHQMASVPGYENMVELSQQLESITSGDAAPGDSRQGLGSAINHGLQKALRAVRNLFSGGRDS